MAEKRAKVSPLHYRTVVDNVVYSTTVYIMATEFVLGEIREFAKSLERTPKWEEALEMMKSQFRGFAQFYGASEPVVIGKPNS